MFGFVLQNRCSLSMGLIWQMYLFETLTVNLSTRDDSKGWLWEGIETKYWYSRSEEKPHRYKSSGPFIEVDTSYMNLTDQVTTQMGLQAACEAHGLFLTADP